MYTLSNLFSSSARVKLLRLFMFNPESVYERADIARRTRITPEVLRRELAMLQRIGMIKKRSFYKEVPRKRSGNVSTVKRRANGWALDPAFVYIKELQQFLVHTLDIQDADIKSRFRDAGTVKFLLVAGVFVDQWDHRIDILLVGDRLNEQKVTNIVKTLEAEIGRELKFAVFATDDFKYRLGVYDKLLRDIFDYDHRILIDRIGLGDALSE